MIKLTSQKMEQIVKDKTGYDVMYLGVFVDNYNIIIQPIRHGFARWENEKMKLISVSEKQIIESISV